MKTLKMLTVTIFVLALLPKYAQSQTIEVHGPDGNGNDPTALVFKYKAISAVPEPGTIALFITMSFSGLGLLKCRRRV